MLYAWIQAVKFHQIVQQAALKTGNSPAQGCIEIDEVHQIPVLIEVFAPNSHLYLVMVAVDFIFFPPVATDEVVLCLERSLQAYGVYADMLTLLIGDEDLYRFARSCVEKLIGLFGAGDRKTVGNKARGFNLSYHLPGKGQEAELAESAR